MSSLKHIKLPEYVTRSGKTTTIELSYQTFGQSIEKAPIVLVIHALTGNSNVCGENGWWNQIIGDNKAIDTKKYSVLAFNIPGNGYDNKEENLIHNYKDFNAADIANLFALALNKLKIKNLFAAIGGSVGGGISWELAALRPNLINHLIPIATDWKATDWLIANCYVQDSILNNSKQPLLDARIHAMTLYRTPESLRYKFNRSKKNINLYNVESWLNYHGKKLTNRFNVIAYKMMNQILKTIDITRNKGTFLEVASTISSTIHIVTIQSDLFFKPEENWNTYVDLKSIKPNISIHEIKSIHGHDAFLIEFEQLESFLTPIFKNTIANKLSA